MHPEYQVQAGGAGDGRPEWPGEETRDSLYAEKSSLVFTHPQRSVLYR